jgi:hypothetical protein
VSMIKLSDVLLRLVILAIIILSYLKYFILVLDPKVYTT